MFKKNIYFFIIIYLYRKFINISEVFKAKNAKSINIKDSLKLY
jgi:hypothetical protein